MPAVLIPHSQIPQLAESITPEMLALLRHLQKIDFIVKRPDLDRKTADALRKLVDMGLIDAERENDVQETSKWLVNGNGSRVLAYRTGIRGNPHYEIPSVELAAWLEKQEPKRWWNVDGDPLLTGRLTFPCPAKILAAQLTNINRPLLIQAKKDDTAANGQVIDMDQLDGIVETFGSKLDIQGEEKPPWTEDRIFYLCWKDAPQEWLLAEDNETTALWADGGVGHDSAKVEKR